jgi:capsular exopolysaccharide synthesis family protein
MEFRDYLRILKARWLTIVISTFVCATLALGVSLLMTPIYQANAVLYVAAPSANINEAYAAGLFSQQRVKSYTRLASTDVVAQKAIDAMKLNMTSRELASRVSAIPVENTVIITLGVTDDDPVRARNLANGVAIGFAQVVEEFESSAGGGPPGARLEVIQAADTPEDPVSPATQKNVLRGLLVGLGLGMALAVIRDRIDSRIKDRRSLEAVSHTALVGELPFDKDLVERPAIDFADSTSESAEAYRNLRTNLQFLDVDHPPRTILVTSAVPEEGKTTAAINLALALAGAGNTVVLLEGDIRRPRVTKYLGLVSAVGLTTILAGSARLQDVTQPTSHARMSVIGSGPVPPNPSELLGSAAFKSLIEELRSIYDYVIIDAPPVLMVSDAAIVSTIVDGVIFAVRHGRTRREEVGRSMANLKAVGVSPLGAIFTMVPNQKLGAYNEGYYTYYDESGEGASPKRTALVPGRPMR